MQAKITQQDVEKMVRHWLATPVNSYLGSDYGFDKHALLFQPLMASDIDEVIAKLKRDVPVLTMLSDDSINIFSLPQAPDKLAVFLQIGDLTFNVV